MSAFFYNFIMFVIIREFLRSLKASFSIICQYFWLVIEFLEYFKVISLSFVGFFLVLFLVKLIIHSYI